MSKPVDCFLDELDNARSMATGVGEIEDPMRIRRERAGLPPEVRLLAKILEIKGLDIFSRTLVAIFIGAG